MIKSLKHAERREAYMHDYDGAITEKVIAVRTAETHAAFLLPHLKPGMSLLDCGSGPGSITLGLANVVGPGNVIGLDLEESQLSAARRRAETEGVSNVRFEKGDVYALPYEDETFDAVFSQALLDHLSDPLAAIREMRRVLKPGGVIGLRDIDLAAMLMTPMDEDLAAVHDVWLEYRRHCGGDPLLGRRLKSLLNTLEFSRVKGSAYAESWSTPDEIATLSVALREDFAGPAISETALAEGWIEPDQLERGRKSLDDWGRHPDAFLTIIWCEALGWK